MVGCANIKSSRVNRVVHQRITSASVNALTPRPPSPPPPMHRFSSSSCRCSTSDKSLRFRSAAAAAARAARVHAKVSSTRCDPVVNEVSFFSVFQSRRALSSSSSSDLYRCYSSDIRRNNRSVLNQTTSISILTRRSTPLHHCTL